MSDINVQRRRDTGLPWWAWFGIVLAIAFLVWAVLAVVTPPSIQETVVPTERVAGEREVIRDGIYPETPATPDAVGDRLPITAMVAAPRQYNGTVVSGTGSVVEVVSENAIWLQEGQRRILVVARPGAVEMPEVSQGQEVRLTGVVRTPAAPPAPDVLQYLERETAEIAQGQTAFIEATLVEPAGLPDQEPRETP